MRRYTYGSESSNSPMLKRHSSLVQSSFSYDSSPDIIPSHDVLKHNEYFIIDKKYLDLVRQHCNKTSSEDQSTGEDSSRAEPKKEEKKVINLK
jgi:hypothetical protein